MFPQFQNLSFEDGILLAGCGGGYDCFVSLPLYFNLRAKYKNVYISNLSFTASKHLEKFKKIGKCCYEINHSKYRAITYEKHERNYFPEYELSRELAESIYAFHVESLNHYKSSLEDLVSLLNIKTIIVCDGGCDSIIKGTEKILGTPVEDMMTIAAVNELSKNNIIKSYLLILGATVDTFVELKTFALLNTSC